MSRTKGLVKALASGVLAFATCVGGYATPRPPAPVIAAAAQGSSSGPVIAWASFFGSNSDHSYESDIAVDASGSVYVVGFTNSPNRFPTTPNAFRRTDPEGDGETFVVKLSPDGSSLVYSTFLGPAFGRSIALDAAGNAYVTGLAGQGFPVRGGFQAEVAGGGAVALDAFLAKLNASGSDLLYSTFIGGSDLDRGLDVAADAEGNAYVSGETSSTNFPVTQGAAHTTLSADKDNFVLKVNTNASGAASLVYSTFTEVGRSVAVDAQGNAYAAGHTHRLAKQSVIKLNPSGTAVVYTHDVNGDAADDSAPARWHVHDIAVDASGHAYVTGRTAAGPGAFPTTGGFQTAFGGRQDAFLAKLDPTGANVLYSTYIGGRGSEVGRGVAVDAAGNAYVSGNTTSPDFPVRDALQPNHNGGIPESKDITTLETGGPTDAFLVKVNTTAQGQPSLVYSSYYGFDRNETGNSVAVDAQGNAYVLGGLAPFAIPGIIHTPRAQRIEFNPLTGSLNRINDGSHFVVKVAGAAAAAVRFGETTYGVTESGLGVRVTVTRTGDASAPMSVDYMTLDGTATGRSDYTSTSGTLRFAAGETTGGFDVLITDDAISEGAETFNVALINPSGGAALAATVSAVVTIADNDPAGGAPNPIDDAEFFVRQHYLDFLGREPDPSGRQFWTEQITSCGADQACREVRRINVSAAFFLSIEFQETGLYAVRVQRAAAGRVSRDQLTRLTYREFIRAARRVGEGVIVGEAGAAERLEANKQAYAEGVVAEPSFAEKFPASLGAAEYVAALYAAAAVTPTAAERQAAIDAYGAGGFAGRVAALRRVADSPSLRAAEGNTAFVLLQYFGYLRRDPDQAGYDFWLGKLNDHGGNFVSAEMVKSFITSSEYRERFGR